ncbi:hypothetical protein [Marinivivus vitaminiproducens]|uniref:hypothetical protein n=1 Tax=Marinivivus vitaminiproducens TaxID=3035935 RepID=UPI0027A496D4|nr:hypothetical protein P4R82_08170 [Geminicoccaceae bacterium SCSIO 64248]
MLGTLTLLASVVLGYVLFPVWIAVVLGVANGFIGLHHPPGRAQALRERGAYWRVLIYSLPLQIAVTGGLYGLGYGLRRLVDAA